jgi:hypothetical protein
MFHKLEKLTAPLLCDACQRPFVTVDDGIVLFAFRKTKNHAPEQGFIVHKNCCDNDQIRRSMELSEFFELRRLVWPLKPATPTGN